MVACGNFSNQYRGEVKTHAMDATMVRVFFVYAELRGWHARTVDIDTAFLRAEFPDDFPLEYILRPPCRTHKIGSGDPGDSLESVATHLWVTGIALAAGASHVTECSASFRSQVA